MVSFRRLMVLWYLILLLIILAISVSVHSQLDSKGFLSIDCGLSETSSYVDEHNLTYVSDQNFIDTGVNSGISSDNVKNYSREYWTVRYFPNEARNCYTLTNLTANYRYLIRGVFYYGNYDKLGKPPIFDIYVGSKFWTTVDANSLSFPETIITTDYDFLEVCLLNTNKGFPFISALHLRQLKKDMYRPRDITSYTAHMILVQRHNFGSNIPVIRYPDDNYDRWWYNDTFNSAWPAISTDARISFVEPDFETPSRVLQTAATTTITNEPLVIIWRSNDTSTQYYVILHYYEFPETSNTGSRDFYIYKNDGRSSQMNSSSVWSDITKGLTEYNVSLVASSSSKLPPAMNAFELYKVAPDINRAFYDNVNAIISIKQYYRIKKGWFGDPCFPTQFLWTGINCSYDSGYASITSLNLSTSLLEGSFIGKFAKLTALKSLDLSGNDLSGSLPPSLDDLTALQFLDITGNKHLSITLPPELLKKHQNGSLTFRYTPSSPSSNKKFIIPIFATVVPLLVIAVAIAIVLGLKKRKYNRSNTPKPNESFESNITQSGDPNLWNHKFCYNDLSKITNDFKNNIGTGGYGSVYWGHLENGVQVAVKILSQWSSQGVKEFLAEAENLARVHHKNLVSLLGCCIDKNCLALVYEYMQGGNLHDKLRDHERPLDWKQRLRIAYESSLGLEYLHKACNPPLIHRDVKTTNILLSANLEAKIADFGLSRAFNNAAVSHVSTRVVGTPGYLDPDYYLSNQLSVKSDVFSFGVVLLEIITGRPPTNAGLDGGNLVQWVRQKLSGGDIEIIVDPIMEGNYDINSVWKVTDLACRCTEYTSSKRPTMAGVVAELKESLDLEMSTEEIHTQSKVNLITFESQDSNLEMTYMGGMPAPGPSVR